MIGVNAFSHGLEPDLADASQVISFYGPEVWGCRSATTTRATRTGRSSKQYVDHVHKMPVRREREAEAAKDADTVLAIRDSPLPRRRYVTEQRDPQPNHPCRCASFRNSCHFSWPTM
jgi:hypothetical protein